LRGENRTPKKKKSKRCESGGDRKCEQGEQGEEKKGESIGKGEILCS